MQRQSLNPRIDKAPQPISLGLRNKKERLITETTPYRVQLDNPAALQSIDNTIESGNVMGNMKQELSIIRKEVERLVHANEEPVPKGDSKSKQNLQSDSLKYELAHQKEVEQTLQNELAQLRKMLKQAEKREEMKTGEHIKEIKMRFKKEKIELTQKIGDLQSKIKQSTVFHTNVQESHRTQLNSLNVKLEEEKITTKKLIREVQSLKKKLKTADQQLEKNQSRISELTKTNQTIEHQRAEFKTQVRQKQHLVKRLNQQIQDNSKESEIRLNNAILEFKKFEQRFNTNNQQTISKFRVRAEELQVSSDTLRQQNDKLRSQNLDLDGKLDRMKIQSRQYKTLNDELTNKLRSLQNQIARLSHTQTPVSADSSKITEFTDKIAELQIKYTTKCSQMEELKNAQLNDEISKLEAEKIKADTEIKHFEEQIIKFKEILASKDEQINKQKDLIDQLKLSSKVNQQQKNIIATLQARYQKANQQHLQTVDEYELKILQLQNEIDQLKDVSFLNQSSSRIMIAQEPSTATFDLALKSQLNDYDSLRNVLKTKQEQILQLKTLLEQSRSKIEAIQSQSQITKLISSGEEKKLRGQFQTTIENQKSQLECQKRKIESLQQKLDYKIIQIKKKDEFITTTIVSKVGKNQSSSESDYIKMKLQEYLSVFKLDQKTRLAKQG